MPVQPGEEDVAQSTPKPPSRRRFLFLVGGAGGLAALGLARQNSNGLNSVSRTSWALGADVTLPVLHENRRTAERAIDDAFAELERIEEAMSLYRPHSQLCRLNREGALDHPDPYLVTVLRASAA